MSDDSTNGVDKDLEGKSGRDLGAALLARARARFTSSGMTPIPVEDWAEAGGEVPTIYAKRVTLDARDMAQRKATKRGFLREGLYCALIVVGHACDENGTLLFSEGDVRTLTRGTDSEIVANLAKEIIEASDLPDSGDAGEDDDEEAEDFAGNLSRLQPAAKS